MKTKLKVYISGPISSDPDFDYRFDDISRKLAKRGYITVNPSKLNNMYLSNNDEDLNWTFWMKKAIPLLCECEAIYMMKGWQKSKGCKTEYYLAKQLGLKFIKL